jgi:transcription initiation factor TFIIIB Brf1 subunit/transcription initiation factor TFIIB
MNVDLSRYTSCFRCGGADLVLDYKAGDIICRECGEVINDRVIDEGNEVKFYMNDDDPNKSSRTSGFSESIGSLQTSFVTSSESVKRTLERAQRFSSDKKELQALAHMNTVSEMCSKMNLIAPIKVSITKLCILLNTLRLITTETIPGRILKIPVW